MKIDIPLPEGKVVSIEAVRDSIRKRRLERKCTHSRVVADQSLMHLRCQDCDEQINPVQWFLDHTEVFQEWERERQRLIQERARYEGKKRCRCEHCNKLTSVRPLSIAELRAFERSGGV